MATASPSERTPLLSDQSTTSHESEQPRIGYSASSIASDQAVDDDSYGETGDRDVENGDDAQQKLHERMLEVRKKIHIIFPAIALGVFLSAADQTIIVTSYGKIGSDLHALNKTSWVASS
jgi:hypothetical protein